MKIKIFTLILLTIFFRGQSQQKGSFTKTITFNSQMRYLVCNVPLNYTNDTTYRLVVGMHGCGGNAIGFRNQLKFLSDSLHAIVVCPVGLTANSGYMGPPDMGIIKTAIDSTCAIYNIDTSEVFLLGFSCNGFAALHDAMFKTNYNYKGVISWHAAIDTSEITTANFNYNTTTKACICTGTADNNYYPTNVILKDTLSVHTATFLFISVPGVGHTTNFPAFTNETMKCFRFMTNVVTPTLQTTGFSQESSRDFGGQIYPNPAGEKITISLKSTFNCVLQVWDSKGEVILTSVLNPFMNEISINDLIPGLYLFKITSPAGDNIFIRIVKE